MTKLPLFPVTVVGSWPRPPWLLDARKRGAKDLGDRIQAALPLDPDSPEAQKLYEEWQQLLAPFKAVASPQMMEGASRLYERMGEWEGEVGAPFSSEVFAFIQAIGHRSRSE